MEKRYEKILVTGAAGRLANYVIPYLVEAGYKVTGFDQFPYAPDSPNANLNVPFVKGDLTSLSDCLRAVLHSEADAVISLGAIPNNTEQQPAYARDYAATYGVPGARFDQRADEDLTMRVNTMGTYSLMDAIRRVGTRRPGGQDSRYRRDYFHGQGQEGIGI